jgi:hypothetical protein
MPVVRIEQAQSSFPMRTAYLTLTASLLGPYDAESAMLPVAEFGLDANCYRGDLQPVVPVVARANANRPLNEGS